MMNEPLWEHDIVKFDDTGEDGYEYKEGFDFKNTARVVFNNGRWALTDFASDNSYVLEEMSGYGHYEDFHNVFKDCEMIGYWTDGVF